MALPDSPNTVYTGNSPVKSTDLNDLQDCAVAGAHGDVTVAIHPTAGWAATPANVAVTGNGHLTWSGASDFYLPLPVLTGDRLKSFTYARTGDGVADFTVTVYKYTAADGATILNASGTSLADNNPSGAMADQIVDLTDTTLAAGETVFVKFVGSATNLQLGVCQLTKSHPLP